MTVRNRLSDTDIVQRARRGYQDLTDYQAKRLVSMLTEALWLCGQTIDSDRNPELYAQYQELRSSVYGEKKNV